jgi:hypothetical protein
MRTKNLTRVAAAVTLAASMLLATAPVARAALAPEQQCAKSRYDAKAKYDQCQAKALGLHFAKNDLAKLQPALSKCRVKYTATYVKFQKKAAGTGATCEAPRFVDNGDGTVTDNLTGLDWEKRTDDGTVHDKDDTYPWSEAYRIFLSGYLSTLGLNEFNSNTFMCFGGLCNWRLPTVAELQTILSEEFPCTTSPCIDPVFGPTIANDDYWSSTTLADNTTYAWGVFFGTGEVSYGLKSSTNSVRAVRGGL